tara:strand:+ start:656 stop:823 length:168 start_codon:yes stop_codon:yes gene_type:complete
MVNKSKEKKIFIALIIWIIWLMALWLRTGKVHLPTVIKKNWFRGTFAINGFKLYI